MGRHGGHNRPYKPLIHVLRIPANGSPPHIEEVKACVYEDSDPRTHSSSTDDLEKRLVHVPNLYGFEHHNDFNFDLNYRELFDRNLDVNNVNSGYTPDSYTEPYYIYKCINKEATGLPRNKHFDRWKDARVYGDAFVFNVRDVREFDGQWMAVFGEMVTFERNLKWPRDWAWKILGKMARW